MEHCGFYGLFGDELSFAVFEVENVDVVVFVKELIVFVVEAARS